MARRKVKFPLKMKNGAEVRSIEDLRENADIESIMRYYFSGQLARWCQVFEYSEIPNQIMAVNQNFIKSVTDMLGVEISEEEINTYIKNDFLRRSFCIDEEVVDNKTVKDKLQEYKADNINLDDYSVVVTPVENEENKVEKYHIAVSDDKNNQYYRFNLPYDVGGSYAAEHFEDDLYKKIIHSMDSLKMNDGYNKIKNSRYVALKAGEIFDFGRYNGSQLNWKILKKSSNSIYAVCTKIICSRKYHEDGEEGSNDWSKCDLRRWLNEDFYNSAFNDGEKVLIETVNEDKISLLTKEDVEQLLTAEDRAIGSWWWLNTAYYSNYAWYVSSDGSLNSYYVSFPGGIRPVLNLKF